MSERKRKARSPEMGARVRYARQRRGFSQQQLASQIGASKLTILRIEHGTNRPTVDVALAICQVLDTSVEALFGGGR